jgi:hypothetical protein
MWSLDFGLEWFGQNVHGCGFIDPQRCDPASRPCRKSGVAAGGGATRSIHGPPGARGHSCVGLWRQFGGDDLKSRVCTNAMGVVSSGACQLGQ